MYPVIILDEFQDTSADEWQLIQLLGTQSKLIALADPEQRIYDFRGADPKRITQFIESFKPKIFDFGSRTIVAMEKTLLNLEMIYCKAKIQGNNIKMFQCADTHSENRHIRIWC